MKTKLLIWGAGGHGKVAADTACAIGGYCEIAFLDDDPSRHGDRVLGFPVMGASSEIIGMRLGWELFIAIGENRLRAEACRYAVSLGFRLATLSHPLAEVSRFASVGSGTLVMARVVINAGACIGTNCIVNTGAIVEHDCVVENHVHVSPAVCIGGGVQIGEGSHLGIGAIVLPGVRIGARTVVGAGCVVRSDLPSDVVAVGVPARIIRYKSHADSSFEPKHNGAGETRGLGSALHAASFTRPEAS